MTFLQFLFFYKSCTYHEIDRKMNDAINTILCIINNVICRMINLTAVEIL